MLTFERQLLRAGIRRIAGVDEAGRGPLAGPVVAAAVVLPVEWVEAGVPPEFKSLNDSKQLSEKTREALYQLLMDSPEVEYACAFVDAPSIDRINILRATHLAMGEALGKFVPLPDHVLVDGLDVPSLAFKRSAIVQGDGKSYSIAAASIVAKVTRDRFMKEADLEYPDYGFGSHKGYGTPRHLEALRRFGPCPLHRKSFGPVNQLELLLE